VVIHSKCDCNSEYKGTVKLRHKIILNFTNCEKAFYINKKNQGKLSLQVW